MCGRVRQSVVGIPASLSLVCCLLLLLQLGPGWAGQAAPVPGESSASQLGVEGGSSGERGIDPVEAGPSLGVSVCGHVLVKLV